MRMPSVEEEDRKRLLREGHRASDTSEPIPDSPVPALPD